MLHLLTHEKHKLSFFILQSEETRTLILAKALMDNEVSGTLIRAYRLVMQNIR